ncbi:MAG: acyltransferase family protein [Muribaculum sp.]|nr:acyltransferase family protein [Muribaculum sp.]
MGHTGFGGGFDKIIHTFHMPLFFFISGYFYRPEKNRDFKKYLIHQINVLLIPYLIFALFYEILHYIYVGEASVQYFIKSLLSSNHNRIDVAGALWFLMSLFSAKIVYNLLEHNIKSISNLTITIITISLLSMTLRRFDIYLPLCLDSALSMLIVVHIGYLLYVYRDKGILHKLSSLNPALIVVIVAIFFITGFANDHVNIRRNRYGVEVLYLISCFCGILLTMNLSNLLSKPTHKILVLIKNTLSFWGRESIVFLLVNELFLFIASELFIVIGVSKSLVAENYLVRLLFMIVAMILMSVLALISRKRPFTYLFGKTKIF